MNIDQQILEKFGVTSLDNGYLYPVYEDGKLVANKQFIKTPKQFNMFSIDNHKVNPSNTEFFGQRLFKDENETLIITCSEKEAMMVHQLYPDISAVSSLFGFVGLRKQIDGNMDFINQFGVVYLGSFDKSDKEFFEDLFSDFNHIYYPLPLIPR